MNVFLTGNMGPMAKAQDLEVPGGLAVSRYVGTPVAPAPGTPSKVLPRNLLVGLVGLVGVDRTDRTDRMVPQINYSRSTSRAFE